MQHAKLPLKLGNNRRKYYYIRNGRDKSSRNGNRLTQITNDELENFKAYFFRDAVSVGSISAVFSSPVFDPPKGDFGVRAGLLPE